MGIFSEKLNEVARSIVPIVVLVLILCLTVVPADSAVVIRFLIGAVMVLLGLAIFLVGIDVSIQKMGEHISHAVATASSFFGVALLAFLIGFLVSVAEPDLLILADQVASASGGTLPAKLLVYIVSAGVGLMIFLGVFRTFLNKKYNVFIGTTYMIIAGLSIFVSEEFLAISFDASGATTGALTTPFILALSAGIGQIKGGTTSDEDSFGLVGSMSAGPILALMLLSIITRQKHIQGSAEAFAVQQGIFAPIMHQIPHSFFEAVTALSPIAALFFIYNAFKFKLEKQELGIIVRGLVYTVLGLSMFLAGVNGGFMDMGRVIGMGLASYHHVLLVAIGLILGFIVVLAEPAVHILAKQVEQVTAGYIPVKLINRTLSIGVALAIAFSTLRIMIPTVKLWYFLLPGFGIAVILSFFCDPVFVGIAYDAGGVASGPITATFVLAFAQGAAERIPTANVLVDGFGIIAMVAMSPVLCTMVLGTMFKIASESKNKEKAGFKLSAKKKTGTSVYARWETLAVSVDRSLTEQVITLARICGARGATILRGLSFGDNSKLFNVPIADEKEVVVMVIEPELRADIINSVNSELDLGLDSFFVMPCIASGIVKSEETGKVDKVK